MAIAGATMWNVKFGLSRAFHSRVKCSQETDKWTDRQAAVYNAA